MSGWRKAFWAVFIAFNIAALAGLLFIRGQVRAQKAAATLPVYGVLRPFSLAATDGRMFDSSRLRGHVWVANFMFTSCPNECPAMNFKVSVLQGVLPKEVQFVSFSVDPETDTPEKLRGYADTFKAEKDRWHFLTGSRDTVGGLLEDCHFARADDPLLHALRLVLVDREGRVRGYYDYTDKELVKKLPADIKSLFREGAK